MVWRLATRFWSQMKQTFADWSKHDAGLLAAAVAYYISWSLFPLLMVLTSSIGFLLRYTGWARDTEAALLDVVAEQTSPVFAQQLGGILKDVETQAVISGPIGLVVLIFTAMIIFVQLETALDRVWGAESTGSHSYVRMVLDVIFGRLRAFLLLLVVGVALVAVFVGGMILTTILRTAGDHVAIPGYLSRWVQIPVVVAANTVLLTVIYKVLSKIPLRWTEALGGALLAAVIWEIGRQVLAVLVIGDRYTAYGLIGSFMAIMLWIYYAMAVLLLGAEYVQVLHHEKAARDDGAGGDS